MRGNTTHRLSGRPCPWLCLHFSVQSKSGQTDYLAPEIKETRWEDKASKSKLMSLNPQGTELSIIIPFPFLCTCNFTFVKLTSVTSLSLGLKSSSNTTSWVNNGRLLHDKTILLQTGNITTGVGQWNFVNFIGIQPDLALSAFEDGSGEALLKFKRHCYYRRDEEGIKTVSKLLSTNEYVTAWI